MIFLAQFAFDNFSLIISVHLHIALFSQEYTNALQHADLKTFKSYVKVRMSFLLRKLE